MNPKQIIEAGKAILGIEFGSTRIKAVLIDPENKPIAQGSHTWENQLVDGLWTYSTEAIWYGLQDCYADLRKNVLKEYDCEIETLAAIGFSAMMHGYMPFNDKGEIMVPFRTWRNTNTGKAAAELSELFNYNIPLRWSISHLYQAILDNEEHVSDITFLTTLAGYVHWQVTGQKVLGVGDASGMIPVDPATKTYDATMVQKFDELIAPRGFSWKLLDILPKSLNAGENAGFLTPEGALKLDVSGHLKPGIPVCPPEGEAGRMSSAPILSCKSTIIRCAAFGPMPFTWRSILSFPSPIMPHSSAGVIAERIMRAIPAPTPLTLVSIRNNSRSVRLSKPQS